MFNPKEDILSNNQHIYKSVKYEYEDMIGCSNIGKIRKKQEDSILLLRHKRNDNFRLIAIADGMGGLKNSELASNILMKNLVEWFETLTEKFYIKIEDTCYELLSNIKYFDNEIRKNCPGGGTTLAIAIVTKNKTLCLNIGDSRIYLYNNNLEQISIDHSIAWELYNKGIIKNKEEMQFHKENNLLTSSFGDPKYRLTPTTKIISNDEYNYIILLTDGITDILTDKEIESILQNFGFSEFLDKIISTAMETNRFQDYLNEENYYTKIVGGYDNLSGIIMKSKIKRRKI